MPTFNTSFNIIVKWPPACLPLNTPENCPSNLCKIAQHYFPWLSIVTTLFCTKCNGLVPAFNTSLPQPPAHLQLRLFTGWPRFQKGILVPNIVSVFLWRLQQSIFTMLMWLSSKQTWLCCWHDSGAQASIFVMYIILFYMYCFPTNTCKIAYF